jgi:hypothetical protein
VGTTGHQNADVAAGTPATESPKQAKSTSAPAPALRKVDGVTDTELAAQLGVTRQAVAGMRKRGTLDKRIAAMLPDLAPIHTNGHNAHNAQ